MFTFTHSIPSHLNSQIREEKNIPKLFFFSFFSIPFHSLFPNDGLKPQIFIPLKLGGMRGNEIRFNEFFTNASFGMRKWNGMERNEKNNFRIFFPSLVCEF